MKQHRCTRSISRIAPKREIGRCAHQARRLLRKDYDWSTDVAAIKGADAARVW